MATQSRYLGGADLSVTTAARGGAYVVSPGHVAECAALWGMGQYEAPLAWMPRAALSKPLPHEWSVSAHPRSPDSLSKHSQITSSLQIFRCLDE